MAPEASMVTCSCMCRCAGETYSFLKSHSENGHVRRVNHLPHEARTQLCFGDSVPVVGLHLNHDGVEGGGDFFGIG